MKQTHALAALVIGMTAAHPAAAQQGAAPPDLAKARSIATQVCAACHGADGNSPSPLYPSLAGQHSAYIAKQLMDFKSGRRKNPIMAGMVASLTPEDMKALGAYFSSQALRPATAKDKALALEGQKLYRGGVLDKAVPACASCHSPDGAGIPDEFPRIGGQYADYTLAQLKNFRSEERANDPNEMMRMIAAKLTDQEMQALADYIAGLR